MEIQEILQELKKAIYQPKTKNVHTGQYYERLKRERDSYNLQNGELKGYNCDKCRNRGNFLVLKDDKIRNELRKIQKSGLGGLFETCTFEKYKTVEPWQTKIKNTAEEFLNDGNSDRNWFYIGGQVGCGKTHICTAIVIRLLNQGNNSRYMLWRDEIVRLKALVTNNEEYFKAINPLKTSKVLYIDDFFKTEKGKEPTTAEINIAFEILNYRYINNDLVTIISSEKSIDDLLYIDEAIGSRIYERTKKYCTYIKPDKKRNYRLTKF